MDKYEYTNGILTFLRKGKRHRIYFLQDDLFALAEVDNEPIDLYDEKPALTTDGRFILSSEGDFLERKDVQIQIKPDGLLRVHYKGQVVLDELPYFSEKDYLSDPSLREKPVVARPRQDFNAEECFAFSSTRPIYGLGDKPGPLDRRGYDFYNWNTDNPYPHTDTDKALYKSIPFFTMFSPKNTVGLFFHNTSKTRFDFNKSSAEHVLVESSCGPTKLYVFLGEFTHVIRSYSRFVGTGTLPRWALGAQQSRWSYADKASVDAVIKGYQEADIPLSAIYLDIDYMDSFKDFTINDARFPNIEEYVQSLLSMGIHLIPIIDAGVKAEEGYHLFEKLKEIDGFCKENGEIYHNEVWPGDSVFPAFLKGEVQEIWGNEVSGFLSKGFGGIWNDMNEPASFKGPLPDDVDMGGMPHKQAHNIYAHFMNKATARAYRPFERGVILTRAAYAGTEKYAATWTGDNQSSYDHVRLCIPQFSSLALSGYSLVGADIGGFNGDCTGELLVRFATVSLFSPIFRNHSACCTRSQEPYAFDEATKKRYRQIVLTRLEILPYLANCVDIHRSLGEPVMRPLIYNFPEDSEVINENTELMLGDSLLLAPALFAGQKRREVYFPDTFYGYFSKKKYEKGYHIIECGLDTIPLFVRANRLVPLAPKGTKSTDYQSRLRLLWTGGEAKLVYREAADTDFALTECRRITEYSVDEEGILSEEVLEHGGDGITSVYGEDDFLISHHGEVVVEKGFLDE